MRTFPDNENCFDDLIQFERVLTHDFPLLSKLFSTSDGRLELQNLLDLIDLKRNNLESEYSSGYSAGEENGYHDGFDSGYDSACQEYKDKVSSKTNDTILNFAVIDL